MERSGPSIEMKIVMLVAGVLVVQDCALLAMRIAGAPVGVVRAVLGGLLVLSVILSAVWGNALSRAVRSLARACYVARKGDSRVLTRLPRGDELGHLNTEINELVVANRDLANVRAELEACSDVTRVVSEVAPQIVDASNELTVSLKELREGSAAELSILRRASSDIKEAISLTAFIAREEDGGALEGEVAAKLSSLGGLTREVEMLADQVVDEVARPVIDEAALARAVNGLRDAARTMADVSAQAAAPLEKRANDAAAAAEAVDHLRQVEERKSDGSRVAELMERSASGGLSAAGRLAASLRKLSLVVESHARTKRIA